jgi:hypothetical protein
MPPNHPKTVTFEGRHEDEIGYHVYLLANEGYIEAQERVTNISFCYEPLLITAKGQEFLAAIRQDSTWARIKSALGDKLKTVPTSVIANTATAIAVEFAKKAMS